MKASPDMHYSLQFIASIAIHCVHCVLTNAASKSEESRYLQRCSSTKL